MDQSNLAEKSCEPCKGGVAPLDADAAAALLKDLHADWTLVESATMIERKLTFKGFAKAVYTANLAAYQADREGHHPDIAFGWGYCTIRFTSHEAGGLTENDFICAAKFDRAVA